MSVTHSTYIKQCSTNSNRLYIIPFHSVQYSTLHYTTLHYTTVQYSTVQYIRIPYPTIDFSIAQLVLVSPIPSFQLSPSLPLSLSPSRPVDCFVSTGIIICMVVQQRYNDVIQRQQCEIWINHDIICVSAQSFYSYHIRVCTYH